VTHNGNLKDKYFVPTANYDIDSRVKWLAGLCDSDGTVSRNGETESLQIGSIHLSFLQEIQLMLQTLGITSTINTGHEEGYREMPLNNGTGENGMFFCQQSYRLLINANGLFKLSELGFETYRLQWKKRRPNRECDRFMTIDSVEDNGRHDDTFCFTEPKRHMGMFNGILTGQCSELNLPADEQYTFSCPIINFNLTLWDTKPDKVFYLLQVMQDCNVSGYLEQLEAKKGYANLFLSKIYNFTKDFRATGMGTCGFHSLLMMKRFTVDSVDAMLLNNDIFSLQREETYEASEWLGEQLGVPDGIKRAGLTRRNATTMFAPPTKSSTELARNSPSEGIGLQTSMVKIKETVGGDILRIEKALLDLMKERGKYTKKEVNKIAQARSVKVCDYLTEHEKLVFACAFECSMYAHLDLCSQRQAFFDQQQSINLYASSSDTEEEIGKWHKYALLDDMTNALYYCYSSRGATYERNECTVCQ
ncbi:MAG: LAGLIDADG family homing endonuclease, partial [Acinetobacter sp.]